MQIYIVAILVAALLIAILFFALRSTVKRIDYNTKKYFVDKLQDYDYLIEEKQVVLNELNEKIEKNKNVLSEIENTDIKEEKEKNKKYYNNITIPKYSDENLFKKYKVIKEKFNFDCEKIIIKFLSNNLEKKDNEYDTLSNLRKKFSNEKIYEIIGMKDSEQKKYVSSILTNEEKLVINKYIDIDKLKIKSFITELDTLIEKSDPIVYVLTGDKNSNYNHLSPDIKTVFDKNINEGIKISYKGIIYDYSL